MELPVVHAGRSQFEEVVTTRTASAYSAGLQRCMQRRAAVTLRSAHVHACVHTRRAIFEGGLLQGFDWIAWSVVGLQVPLASFPSQLVLRVLTAA